MRQAQFFPYLNDYATKVALSQWLGSLEFGDVPSLSCFSRCPGLWENDPSMTLLKTQAFYDCMRPVAGCMQHLLPKPKALENQSSSRPWVHWKNPVGTSGASIVYIGFLCYHKTVVLSQNLINVHWQTMFLGMEQLRKSRCSQIRWWEVLRGT